MLLVIHLISCHDIFAGRNKGLVVILDAHSDVFSVGSVDSNSEGFVAMISPVGSFPFATYEGIEIR